MRGKIASADKNLAEYFSNCKRRARLQIQRLLSIKEARRLLLPC